MIARTPALVLAIAAAGAFAHAITIARYGVFRDELYYVACGERLAWGYVDHPPLVAVLAWVSTHLLGGSLPALRVPAVLCGVLTVLVAASLVRRLGGGVWAQAAAALCITIAPHYLFVFHVLSMNGPEILLWTVAARLLAGVLAPGARSGNWVALGLVLGVAALNKVSAVFWGAGLLAGVLVSPARGVLRQRGPWIAVALAAFVFHPFLVWQHEHGWPVIEFVRNAQRGKIVPLSPGDFLSEQVLMMHPLAAPIWITGFVAGIAGWRRRESERVIGAVFVVAWLVVLGIFLAQRSKAYYLTPAFPPLLVLGAVALERWRHRIARPIRAAAPPLWIAGGLVTAPLVLPILEPGTLVRYRAALGMANESAERHVMGDLPQHFADMHGWEEMARTVSAAYAALPVEERRQARFYGQNYGEAGAIEYYGGRYALPRAISGHNSYWIWGPGPPPVGTVLVLGGDPDDHRRVFTEVDSVGRHDAAWAMPYERDLTLWRCRTLRMPLADAWAASRHYD